MELQDQLVIATPEGVDLTLELAGLGSRGIALLIDLAIQLLVMLLTFSGLAVGDAPSGFATALFLLVAFSMLFGYFVVFEAFTGGRTPGKRALGLRVVSVDGGPLTFWKALIRNLLRLIDLLPNGYVVGMVAVLATPRNQRVGDLAAGTIVVRERKASEPSGRQVPAGASPAVWAGAVAAAPPLPPEVQGWDVSLVTPDEVAAIRTFLDRRWSLPAEARQQLAADFARRLQSKVVGVPVHEGPERFLEWIVTVKSLRA